MADIPATFSIGGTDHVAPYRARMRLGNLVGRSAALANLLRQAELAAASTTPVLIKSLTSGCGKATLARIIHDNGARRERPLVRVECASLGFEGAEREVFGSVQSTDGCASETTGKIGAAEGGTLLLREVSALSRSGQSKLLHFLLTNEFSPAGSSTPRRADVRILASCIDPAGAVEHGWLSEELFFRLNIVAIDVPPLGEHREDIAPLAHHFVKKAQQTHRVDGIELTASAVEALEAAGWAGDVRMLSCVVECGVIRVASEGGPRCILPTHLF